MVGNRSDGIASLTDSTCFTEDEIEPNRFCNFDRSIKVGADTKIGAGSVVLEDLPSGSTAVGIPARVINRNGATPEQPSLSMDQTSYITDYFI